MSGTITMTRPVTSPSNLHRRKSCPGSARMEAQCPEPEDSEYSAEGTLLHRHFADKALDRSGLTPKQRDVLEIADRSQAETIAQVCAAAGIPEDAPFHEGYERPVTLRAAGMPGTCDYWRHHYMHEVLLIEDAKMGYLLVTAAESNLQLGAYACMAAAEMPAARVYAAINQPRAPFDERRTLAVYPFAGLPTVISEIVRIIEATEDPDAPLNPSEDACRYCRAKQICPAFRGEIEALATVDKDSLLSLPAADFTRIGHAIKLANQIKGPWTHEALRRIDAGELPGWKTKDNGTTTEIDDLMVAYQRFAEHYGPKYEENPNQLALDFLACTTLRIGDFTTLLGKLEGVGESKARRVFYELLDGLVTKVPKAMSPVMPKE